MLLADAAQVEDRRQGGIIEAGGAAHADAPLGLESQEDAHRREVVFQYIEVGLKIVIAQSQVFPLISVAALDQAAGDGNQFFVRASSSSLRKASNSSEAAAV